MAKVKGVVVLRGTIGGITFYDTPYGQVARAAGGGFNGEAIRTKPSMQRVRENGREFGHCSKANKLFRQAIGAFHEHYKFAGFHGYLMRLFTQLKDLDTIAARGQRQVGLGVHTEAGRSLLRHFEYTPDSHVERFFPYQPHFLGDASLFRYEGIDMGIVTFPKGATHLKLLLGVVALDFNTMVYHRYAAAPVLIDRHFEGGPLDIPLNTISDLPYLTLPIVGMRYYQRVGGALLPLHDATFVSLNVLEDDH